MSDDLTREQLLEEIETIKKKSYNSEKFNESIVKTAKDAIITIDRNGLILSHNNA